MKNDSQQLKLKDKDNNSKDLKETKPSKKKVDYEGSRYSSLILLCLTMLMSFFLYLTGNR